MAGLLLMVFRQLVVRLFIIVEITHALAIASIIINLNFYMHRCNPQINKFGGEGKLPVNALIVTSSEMVFPLRCRIVHKRDFYVGHDTAHETPFVVFQSIEVDLGNGYGITQKIALHCTVAHCCMNQ